ncbi:GNAT family N-acetyltransferase [Haloprofundus halobius]|uniref:GNAT family N-acetyltransferase n=1 Tax=Haloprofundus halobius TaxID=2876194 RepID=UPI001CCFB96C|nr:GNAT family N-acetyltransferase [Haloprofundus halobius]
MEIRRLRADEAAVRRWTEELWLPYHRDLEAAVDAHELADDVDLVAEETAFRLDRLEAESYRVWVAVDRNSARDTDAETETDASVETDIEGIDAELVGFVTAEIERAPSVFDHPDRVLVGDIYVRESHRGTGLARELVDRTVELAAESDCAELALDVDADNDRAMGFYEKLGFETRRRRMAVAVDDL